MKKILIAILAGLLLIGAVSGHVNAPTIGIAKSNAEAFAKGKAIVDYDLVATSTVALDKLLVQSVVSTKTWEVADSKVDPIAASYSEGAAIGLIDGKINVNHGHTAMVQIYAQSGASAYNAARGSLVAVGETETKNFADTWANEHSLGSVSTAMSESEGFAKGVADPKAKITEITDLVPVEPVEPVAPK